jgi:IS30 family transposase
MVEWSFHTPITKEEAITMDCHDYITVAPERKRGQHLGQEERGAIKQLKKQGYSLRAIAREINCSPSTVMNELRRGTPLRKSHRGRAPEYSAKRGRAVYEANRMRCRRHHRIVRCSYFIQWMVKQVRKRGWSLDVCVGYARLHRLFAETELVCTKTLYNELAAGNLPLSLFEMPEVLKRKRIKRNGRAHKRLKGRSIDERPEIVDARIEIGHWEADTVIGRRNGKEAAVLTLVERVTNNYLAIRIPGKNSDAVIDAMRLLRAEYGELFSKVFKSITTDNGSEFEDFAQLQDWGADIYFAHPYSSWERPVNERHNGLLRQYIPKGVSIEKYTPEDVLSFADELNSRPRRRLGYRTPEELFDAFLDSVYAA